MNKQLEKYINAADAIVIGAGSGLSAAAGFEYGGETFLKHFKYMYDEYGYKDMYSAGFHWFDSLEDYWGYWSKFVYLERYETEVMPLYKRLYEIMKDKNYFVITTNVDHQFQKAQFDKNRLYYTQGDYGLFQCSLPCHKKTYDNKEQIIKMMNNQKNHKIPTELIPKCPKCGRPISMNLRCDETFVEDEYWHEAKARYEKFLQENNDKKVLFLELGVGYNTPVIIKYPFMRMTYNNPKATYVIANLGYNEVPKEIKNQTIMFDKDINSLFEV